MTKYPISDMFFFNIPLIISYYKFIVPLIIRMILYGIPPIFLFWHSLNYQRSFRLSSFVSGFVPMKASRSGDGCYGPPSDVSWVRFLWWWKSTGQPVWRHLHHYRDSCHTQEISGSISPFEGVFFSVTGKHRTQVKIQDVGQIQSVPPGGAFLLT